MLKADVLLNYKYTDILIPVKNVRPPPSPKNKLNAEFSHAKRTSNPLANLPCTVP